MRRILQTPTYGVSGLFAMAIKSATGLRSGTGACLASRPMTLHVSVRAQGGFGGGRPARGQRGGGGGGNEGGGRGGGGGSGGGAAQSKGGAARRTVINKTGDGELSDFTRIVMRDDSHILKNIVKHIPQNGAISVKSLHAQLSPDVQEAIAEKYDGLKNFLEQRKQLFVVKTNPADGVLYAAATPLAMQKLVAREKQRETMQEMLGINSPAGSGKRGGRGGNRGGGGGGGIGEVVGTVIIVVMAVAVAVVVEEVDLAAAVEEADLVAAVEEVDLTVVAVAVVGALGDAEMAAG
ncbi:hypothetical protein TCSYLVIO_006361 [Trypanosoma cruzi]|nr:hypothetical protein TCSYLVIO_006361 [Trypanosoma cruzi]